MEFLFILFGVIALLGIGMSMGRTQQEQGTYIYIPPQQVQQGPSFLGFVFGAMIFAGLIFAVVQAVS